jgi:hypothetical protein
MAKQSTYLPHHMPVSGIRLDQKVQFQLYTDEKRSNSTSVIHIKRFFMAIKMCTTEMIFLKFYNFIRMHFMHQLSSQNKMFVSKHFILLYY